MKETLHTRRSVLGMFIDLLLSPCLSLSLFSLVCLCVYVPFPSAFNNMGGSAMTDPTSSTVYA